MSPLGQKLLDNRSLRNPVVQRYIAEEVERQKKVAEEMPDDRNHDWMELNRIFINILREENLGADAGAFGGEPDER